MAWSGKPASEQSDNAATSDTTPGAKKSGWSGKPANEQSAVKPEEPRDTSLLGFFKQTGKNIPGSAVKAVGDIAEPFLHPIQTAENFADLGKGIAQYLGLKSGTDFEKYPDAVGRFFAERYGGIDKVLDTIRTDPVGFAMDASVLLSGGGTLAARAPGAIGEVGKVVSTVGRAIDPVAGAGRAMKGAAAVGGDVASKIIGGTRTFTGDKPIQTAFRSGKEGGQARQTFLDNLRQQSPKESIVLQARQAVGQLRKERGDAYRQGMANVSKDKTILSWNDVDTALNDMDKVATFKGEIVLPSTEAVRNEIKAAVNDWKQLQASEFWTPEGFDALKKKVGDIRDRTEIGTADRLVADQAYHGIRDTIVRQSPEYAGIMHAYEAATDLIKQMDKELSVNPNAGIGTTLRKLQAVLRDNVNTSYGYRAELADVLVNAGAPHLLEAIAGQAMSSWTPRGLGALAAGLDAMNSLYHFDTAELARAAVILGLSSPRLMGETASAMGAASRYGGKVPLQNIERSAFEIGRIPPITESAQKALPPQ